MPVYKDKKRGTYYFITRVKNIDGNTKQVKRRRFKTKHEALLAEAKVIDEAEQGLLDMENPTFEFIADEYLRWYKRRRKASSYTKIESIVRVNLKPEFGKKRIRNIMNRDVRRFQDDLIDAEYSVHHIKKVHQTLSAIFNFAIKEQYTDHNPARAVGNIEDEPTRHINYWTLEEFKSFMEVVDNFEHRTLFMTLYYSGMRKGELCALTWKDIDFDNNTINIDKTAYNTRVTTPKTLSSIRKLEMPKYVMAMLRQLKNIKKPKQKIGYYVFGKFYDHLPAATLDRWYHNYMDQWVEKEGFTKEIKKEKRIRIHDFRHSHASYLINKGAIPAVVAKRLGHKDVATTLNTYSHLYPSTEKEIISQMEDDFKIADVIQLKLV